jgi:DNA-binding GntR family transcriptional regulator
MSPQTTDGDGKHAAAEPGDESSTDRVHDVLRRLILDGELAPSAELSQLELSKRLKVSRTPLREALRLLEREGLVVNEGRHQLVRTSALSMPDLDDLYAMRVIGEALAIAVTVSTFTKRDLDELARELKATRAGSAAERAQAHRRFHALLRTGGGPRLRDHLDRLFEHAERYRLAYSEPDAAVAREKHLEHVAILDACRAGDAALARDLLVDHIADTAMTLMTRQRYAPFALPTAIAMAKSGANAAV